MKKYQVIACAMAVFLLSGCTQNEKAAQTEQTQSEQKSSSENSKKDTNEDKKDADKKTTENKTVLTKEQLLEKAKGHPDDIYFADFDQNGTKEAFIIKAEPQHIQKGQIVNVYDQCSIFLVNDQGESLVAENISGFPRGIFKVGDELFFFFEENAHGPGSRTHVYRVKNDKVEELNIPKNAGRFAPVTEPFGEVMFKLDPSYEFVSFENDYKDGGGRLDIPTYYSYNKETGQFVVEKAMTREEYEKGEENSHWENPLKDVKKEWKD